ncbi:MAG: flagellar protein FlaG [Clostridiales bacterium]|nr:flagellar protein FlaG [Clostridiales bacterium]
MRIDGVSSFSKIENIEVIEKTSVKRMPSNEIEDKGNDHSLDIKTPEERYEMLVKAVDDSNNALETHNRRFDISIHEHTGTIMVKVIDTNTDEIIREIPPEKILDMAAALWELAGIIIDRKI